MKTRGVRPMNCLRLRATFNRQGEGVPGRREVRGVCGGAPVQERSRQPPHGDRPQRGAAERRWKPSSWRRTTAQYGEPAGVGPAAQRRVDTYWLAVRRGETGLAHEIIAGKSRHDP